MGEGLQLPTASQFRSLTRLQLAKLVEEDGVEVPSTMSKRKLVALAKELFCLEDLWAEQKDEKEHKFRLAKEERERQFQLEKLRLEIERAVREKEEKVIEPAFSLQSAERLLPQFNEEEVDVFFEAFERVATDLYWPRSRWALLIQRALVGNAFAALDTSLALEYESVKEAVLTAYGGVPDENSRKFRSYWREVGESHLNLYRRQQILMARWLNACKADSVEVLRELFLMEQFRNCLSRDLEVYVAERGVKTVKEVAELSDTWEVIQYGGVWCGPHDRGHNIREPHTSSRPEARRSGGAWQAQSSSGGHGSSQDIICHNCQRPGHIQANCPALRSRVNRDQFVALMSSRTPGPGAVAL